jgi:hypothetical protein
MGDEKPYSIAADHSSRTLMPWYGMPFPRKGRVMRPAACSAFQRFIQGRTPFLKFAHDLIGYLLINVRSHWLVLPSLKVAHATN